MTRQSFSRASGLVARSLRSTSVTSPSRVAPRLSVAVVVTPTLSTRSRFLSTTSPLHKGILPDSDDPSPPNVQPTSVKATPAALSDEQYHALSEEYMDTICSRLEDVSEKNSGVDVEYSAGVLNVSFPTLGTYVINKQPPNKQIWLSSPKSGPKRYDYVVYGEGQGQKEDTAVGDWVYLRDGSTINQLFREELDIDMDLPLPQ
ncbi:unnamed protein product [Discula destructiva]